MDTAAAPANLLDAPTLAQSLKAAFLSSRENASASEDAAAACEAIRAAIETCENAAALLQAELVGPGSEDNDDIPLAKRRAVERNQAASDVSGVASSSAANAAAGKATLLSTKTLHTQQPDGSWSTAIVPCEPQQGGVYVRGAALNVRGAAPVTEDADLNILTRMQDEVRRQVLDYFRGNTTRDLGRLRIASKAMHEAMMGTELNLLALSPPPSVAQLTALGRGTTLHKFKQVPEEQRCSCVAGRVLDRTSFGCPLSADGWGSISDYTRLALGVGRSWRVTELKSSRGASVEQWKALLGSLNLAETLSHLWLKFSGGAFNVSSDP